MENESNLSTLNGALHDQLKRINDPDLKGDELTQEIERSRAVIGVSKEIIGTGRLVLDAAKLRAEYKGLQSDDVKQLQDMTSAKD